MRNKIRLAAIIVFLLLAVTSEAGTPVHLKFENVELRDILRALASASGETVAVTVDVDPDIRLTIDAGNVGVGEAFEIVVREAELYLARVGEVLIVSKEPILGPPSN